MNQNTLEQLHAMKLFGMANSFKALIESHSLEQYTHDQMVAALVQAEWEGREHKKIAHNISQAKFRYTASIEEIDYTYPRNLDKNQMLRFTDCSYIKNAENILVSGATGVGKSYIISALGYQACIMGYKVGYYNLQKLLTALRIAKADGSYLKTLNRIEKQDLLILDDYGLQPLDNNACINLLELIEDRYGRRATIMSSQLPFDKWYDICTAKTIADAIFDRLINGSHKIQLKGYDNNLIM